MRDAFTVGSRDAGFRDVRIRPRPGNFAGAGEGSSLIAAKLLNRSPTELVVSWAYNSDMKSTKRSTSRDRKRVSLQNHEIKYAAGKLKTGSTSGSKAKAAVLKAKKGLGRKTSRKAVMSRARKLANT